MKSIKLFDDPNWEKSVDALDTLLAQYQHFLSRVLAAEKVLRENGLRIDPKTGKVKFVSSKREYLNRIIVSLFSEGVGRQIAREFASRNAPRSPRAGVRLPS